MALRRPRSASRPAARRALPADRAGRGLAGARERAGLQIRAGVAVAAGALVVATACGSDPARGSSTYSVGSRATAGAGQPSASGVQGYEIQIVSQYPHDTTSWTEGLEFHQGQLLESTGRTGQSTLRFEDPTTGEAQAVIPVAKDLYAEGVTVVGGQALQLTWQDRTLLSTPVTDPTQAAVSRRDGAYDGEGWGLCNDGTALVMSNGSDQLQFRDPSTFALVRTVAVTRSGSPLAKLNELECVNGRVWANVWLTNDIVVINPTTGVVEGQVDASSLVPAGISRNDGNKVLNGIAYNPDTERFWLTGKLWPVIYEVELRPTQP